MFEIRPTVENVAQPAVPPADETNRLVVEAVVTERLVEVALVELELIALNELGKMTWLGREITAPDAPITTGEFERDT